MMILELKDDRSEKVRYDYGDYPIYIRRGLLSTYPNFAAPVHWHDDIELIVVLSGEMQYNVNGEVIQLQENEGIIVNARQLHFGFSEARTECDFICVLFHPLLLCATAAYERDFVLPVLHNQRAAFVKLDQEAAWKQAILENGRRLYAVKGEKAAPIKAQVMFLDIWVRLYENIAPESKKELQNTDLSILKNMIGFIQQNYTEKISLGEIAASGAVGQSKCCRLFGKYIRQTPNAYLTQYRLDKSTELLKHTDMTMTEVAHATGFGGSSYYAEAFRRWSGTSPSAYRKMFLSGSSPAPSTEPEDTTDI